ncbi:MAG TPA: hypothetical protein VFG64_15040 [Dongiaceae bacterium]|nr:hypothetical protein [Dongiaceae bacterium]
MTKVAFMAALLRGAILATPVTSALADSTEPASGTTDDSAQPADPDDPLGDIATPNPATDPSAAIALPPIYVPDGDSGDYSPPESDDDGADNTGASSDGTQN